MSPPYLRMDRGRKAPFTIIAGLATIVGCAPSPVSSVHPPAVPMLQPPPTLQQVLDRVSGQRIAQDVARFSNEELNGRQTGTADDRRGALLVATLFHSFGLKPGGTVPLGPGEERWSQTASVPVTRIGELPLVHFTTGNQSITPNLGRDYLPILDSPSVDVTAPIVFVGYGIVDPARELDEYQGIDVRNRVVMVLRGKPEGYPVPLTQTDKERMAREKGASAMITLNGPILSAYETRRGGFSGPVASYSFGSNGSSPIPGMWISTALGEAIFQSQGQSLRAIQERLNKTLRPSPMLLETIAHLKWDASRESGTLVNVLGILSFQKQEEMGHGDQVIVIGAHRDHFGRQAGLLFPGADDNASGTAVMLEIARLLATSNVKFTKTLLFVSFSGEEQNLLGSRLYVSAPTHPLSRTLAMINIDHAGIGNGRLTVGLTGLPKDTGLKAAALAGLSDKLDAFGFFPGGDHVPFKEANVPTVTVVSGGPHPHFHQPSDGAGTVSPEILESAAKYVLACIWELGE